MKKEWVLDQEAFDKLLLFLNPEREDAARKYETIRRRLIEIFSARGCLDPESLTDETINRVTVKVAEIAGNYVGEPALYFYAVAKRIYWEYINRKPVLTTPLDSVPERQIALAVNDNMIDDDDDDDEQEYACMLKCLNELPQHSRELIQRYYQPKELRNRVNRNQMAQRFKITANALRIKAHRIRVALKRCVELCLQQQA